MFMHLPAVLAPGKLPLVVVLHGCTQTAASISNATGWNKLADEYGFYVLYPQQTFSNNPAGCFNWFHKNDISKDEGEVLSIKQMVDMAKDSFSIDSTRIFVFGISAGAAMGVALLANYPSLFNTGAMLAGGPFMSTGSWINGIGAMHSPKKQSADILAAKVRQQNPDYKGNYPRLIVMHGKQDNVVNIKNSYQLISQWAAINNMDSVADDSVLSFTGDKNINRYSYKNTFHETKIIFYEVDQLGHELMIDPGVGKYQGGEREMFTVDKGFYSVYWIGKEFGIIH